MIRIGVTGHQKLSKRTQEYCKLQFRGLIEARQGLVIGISSLAAGADQIFAQEILFAHALLWVVKPSSDYESTLSGPELQAYSVMSASASRIESLAFTYAGEDAYAAAGEWIVDNCDLLVAAWDGQEARGLGGTGDVVKYARSLGREIEIVWPEGEVRE